MKHWFHTLMALFGLLSAASSDARSWYVRPDGSGDATTIQAAVDSAIVGDEVLLAPGTYSWTSQGASGLTMLRIDRELTLRGEAGATQTILDAEQLGRVVLCQDAGRVRIEGLTVTGGQVVSSDPFAAGAGILVVGESSPTLRACIVRGNLLSHFDAAAGGGIACADARIENCKILENEIQSGTHASGGGIACQNSILSGCLIRDNVVRGGDGSAGGAGVRAHGGTLADCRIEGNVNHGSYFGGRGGGMEFSGTVDVIRCLFVRNEVLGGRVVDGGGVHCYDDCTFTECVFVANRLVGDGTGFIAPWGGAAIAGGRLTLTGCTVVGNVLEATSPGPQPSAAAIVFGAGSTVRSSIVAGNQGGSTLCRGGVTWTCNDVHGNAAGDALCDIDGGGNFNADTEFCAVDPVASMNFTLQADSPCAPGQHPFGNDCGQVGAAPVGCDAVSIEATTWSQLKSLFR